MSEMNQNRAPSNGKAPGHGRREAPRRQDGRGTGKRRRPIGVTVVIRILQVLGTLLLVGVVTGSFLACYAAVYVKTVVIPQAVQTTQSLSNITLNENSVIYYQDKESGQWVELQTLVGTENREVVAYGDIPEDLVNAFVAIEDKRFYTHHGVDWIRTANGVLRMFTGGNIQGGSTITQQLIKNLTEYDDVTVTRKIQEIFTALEVENNYEKTDIIAWYLNEIYLGNGCYGVQAAAQYYFGKDVSDLTLAECASLAGITNNPSQYSPDAPLEVTRYKCNECGYYSLSNDEPCDYCGAENWGPAEVWTGREYNKARQELILKNMADPDISENGAYITQIEYEAALAEPLVFRWDKSADGGDDDGGDAAAAASAVNSWYVDAVISETIKGLMETTGLSEEAVKKMVYSGGLSIYVPFDPDVQAAVDAVYNDRSNLDYTSKTGQELMSAITVVDNRTGYVVAMAGNVGEKTVDRGWNAAVDTHRQPGSSIKPLSVYSPALEMGLITPATVVDDTPVMLMNGKAYPLNLPRGYKGLTTVLDGVTRSVNTVAMRVLSMVTLEESYNFMAEKYGISLEPGRYVGERWMSDIDWGPLAMGGLTDGVSTFEMAAAYAVFPRNGAYTAPTTYLLVKDVNGKVLIDNTPDTDYVIKPSTAYYINSMLTNAVNSGTGTGARISGQTVAGKTGTTDNGFDLWFAGYTTHYTAAVWTGYSSSEYINLSGNPSVTLWRKVMELVLADLPNESFYVPGETKTYDICTATGLLATDDCRNDLGGSRVVSMTLLKGDGPTEYCTAHVPVTICLDSPILDANGNPTGAYYLATEFCPEESVKEVTMVDYDRELVDPTVVVSDYYTLLSVYDTLEDPYCPIHEEVIEPPIEEPPIESGGPEVSDPPVVSSEDPEHGYSDPPVPSEEVSPPPAESGPPETEPLED